MPTSNPPTPDATPDADALPAYLLAGGKSIRFGSDKARAIVSGQPLITHTANTLRQVARCITVIASQPDQYADLGLDTIADTAPDHGPVQGLLEALIHRLEHHGEGWLILAACDMLTPDATPYLELLDALPHRPKPCGVLAFRTDRWHPMPGLYHTSILPFVAAFLADGGRAFQKLLAKKTVAAFAPRTDTDPLAKLIHANTPNQLQQGLARKKPNTSNTPRDKA